MVISDKLRREIHTQIEKSFFEVMVVLDEKDRSDKIPHSEWRDLYKKVIDMKSQAIKDVMYAIDMYTGRR